MLNWIWMGFLVIGVLTGAVNGNLEAVTQAALTAAENAVQCSLKLIGVMSLWLGMMKIAEDAGCIQMLARGLAPVMRRLFPEIPSGHPALGAILMNLSANMLGLGNAATPFGMKAMQEMKKLHPSDTASDAMCTFLALNTSCITLLPATIIGLRVAAGSQAPAEITGACIFATLCSSIVAVLLDGWFRKYSPFRHERMLS